MDTFAIGLSFLIPFGVIAIIIFAIAGIMEGKNTMKKGSVIRSLYFYVASLITLAIVVGSLVFLINLGLKVSVFTDADSGYDMMLGAPPTLYLSDSFQLGADKPVSVGEQGLTCENECTLTDAQQSSIQSWKTSYQNWIDVNENPGSRHARDAVAALSFLIIALPFFLIHFRIVQKDAREAQEDDRGVIRPTYFYFVSLASLLMIVIAGGFLINIALKTWVFPSAGEADDASRRLSIPIEMATGERSMVKSLVTCGEPCGVDQETIALAQRWDTDYTAWQESSAKTFNNRQRQAASAISYVLLGIPLFWYHWVAVRKEAKEKKAPQNTPTA